jgi:hypothetical protein
VTGASIVVAHHPNEGEIEPKNLKAKGTNPELYTDAARVAAGDQFVASHGIAPLGGPYNQITVNVLDTVKADKPA